MYFLRTSTIFWMFLEMAESSAVICGSVSKRLLDVKSSGTGPVFLPSAAESKWFRFDELAVNLVACAGSEAASGG